MRRRLSAEQVAQASAKKRLSRMTLAQIHQMNHEREAAIGIHPKYRSGKARQAISVSDWEQDCDDFNNKFMQEIARDDASVHPE